MRKWSMCRLLTLLLALANTLLRSFAPDATFSLKTSHCGSSSGTTMKIALTSA